MHRALKPFALLLVPLVIGAVALACNGGGGDEPPDAAATTPTRVRATTQPQTPITLRVEGDFVAPDSHAFSSNVQLAGLSRTRDVVVIGDDVWNREGSGEWTQTTRADAEFSDFAQLSTADPTFLQDQSFAQDLASLDGEPETINGVDTVRYIITRETVQQLRGLFGGEFLGDASGLQDFEMTVWLDKETQGIVRAEISATGNADLFRDAPFELATGSPIEISMRIDLTNINDTSITVEPPVAGAAPSAVTTEADLPFDSFHYTVDIQFTVTPGARP